jgi:hypothetical protein
VKVESDNPTRIHPPRRRRRQSWFPIIRVLTIFTSGLGSTNAVAASVSLSGDPSMGLIADFFIR